MSFPTPAEAAAIAREAAGLPPAIDPGRALSETVALAAIRAFPVQARELLAEHGAGPEIFCFEPVQLAALGALGHDLDVYQRQLADEAVAEADQLGHLVDVWPVARRRIEDAIDDAGHEVFAATLRHCANQIDRGADMRFVSLTLRRLFSLLGLAPPTTARDRRVA